MNSYESSAWQMPAVCISSLAILASVVVLWKKSQRKEQDCKIAKTLLKPEKWVKVGRVSKLIVYPVKSCAGVVIDKGIITTLGLKCHNANFRDRDFMVVSENGKPITLDKYPKMALIKFEVGKGDTLTVSAPDMPPFTFTYPKPNEDNQRSCRIDHDANIKALDCGDDVAQWFQEYLGNSTFRVYYHHLNATQRTFQRYAYQCPQYEPSDLGSFQNETSYLVCAQESIEELNKRLDKDSSWKNWRPSILIDQVNEAFAEINWSFVRIGNKNGILKTAVPCKRCPITTVDSDTGIMPKDGEPLKTLREMNVGDEIVEKKLLEVFRNKGVMGVRMGLYLPAGEGAEINIGDPVYAALL